MTTALSAPPGYTWAQLIFDDQFPGTTLNTNKWFPGIGDPTFGPYRRSVTAPYTAWDAGGDDQQYVDPYPAAYGTNTNGPHTVVNNGVLQLIATPSTKFNGYTWAVGTVSTFSTFTF